MPHITVEYTKSLQESIETNKLLPIIHDSLLSHEGVFSASGIRSRAVMLSDYLRGTGSNETESEFIHITLKILKGRSESTKQQVLDHLIETVDSYISSKAHGKQVALSIALVEFNDAGNMYVQN